MSKWLKMAGGAALALADQHRRAEIQSKIANLDIPDFEVSKPVAEPLQRNDGQAAFEAAYSRTGKEIYASAPAQGALDLSALVHYIYPINNIRAGGKSTDQIFEDITSDIIGFCEQSPPEIGAIVWQFLYEGVYFPPLIAAETHDPMTAEPIDCLVRQLILLDTLQVIPCPEDSSDQGVPASLRAVNDYASSCRAQLAKSHNQFANWSRGKYDWSSHKNNCASIILLLILVTSGIAIGAFQWL